MSILQISKIQVRRGQKNDSGIPLLSSGEIAWANDAQELYIGNGTIEEGAPLIGNTRILTERDYADDQFKTSVLLPIAVVATTAFSIICPTDRAFSIRYVITSATDTITRSGVLFANVTGGTVAQFSDEYIATNVDDPLVFSAVVEGAPIDTALVIKYTNTVAATITYAYGYIDEFLVTP